MEVFTLAAQAVLAGVIDALFASCVGIFLLRPALPSALEAIARRRLSTSLGLSTIGYLFLAAINLSGMPVSEVIAAVALVLTQSQFGTMWSLEFAACCGLTYASWQNNLSITSRARQALTIASLMLFAVGRAASGHAGESGLFSMIVVFQTIHLLAAGAWGGGVLVAAVTYPAWRLECTEKQMALAQRLSTIATIGLVLVLGSGLINAAHLILSAEDPLPSVYLGILLLKMTLVAGAAGLGALNRFAYLPRLGDASGRATNSFVRVLLTEAALFVVIFFLAAQLASSPAPT